MTPTVQRTLKALAALAALALSIGLANPNDAHAFGIKVGGGPKFSALGATIGDDNAGQDLNFGYGGGAMIFGMAQVHDRFAIGLNFDIVYTVHTTTQQAPIEDTNTSWLRPSFGLIMHYNLKGKGAKKGTAGWGWSFMLWANYGFGNLTFEQPIQTGQTNVEEIDVDTPGGHFGLAGLYRIQFGGAPAYVEVGPFLNIDFLDARFVVSENANGRIVNEQFATVYSFGVQAQFVYDIRL